jgi:hypothetical protein
MILHHTLHRKLDVLIPTLPEYAKSQVSGHRPDLRHRHAIDSKRPDSNRYPIQSGSAPEPTISLGLHSRETPNGL